MTDAALVAAMEHSPLKAGASRVLIASLPPPLALERMARLVGGTVAERTRIDGTRCLVLLRGMGVPGRGRVEWDGTAWRVAPVEEVG